MDPAYLTALIAVVLVGSVAVALLSALQPPERLLRSPRDAAVVAITGTMGAGISGVFFGSELRGLLFGAAVSIPVAFVPPAVRRFKLRRRSGLPEAP